METTSPKKLLLILIFSLFKSHTKIKITPHIKWKWLACKIYKDKVKPTAEAYSCLKKKQDMQHPVCPSALFRLKQDYYRMF